MSVEISSWANILSQDDVKEKLKSLQVIPGKNLYVHLNEWARINGESVSNFCLWIGMWGTYFVSAFNQAGNNRVPCVVHQQEKASGSTIEAAVDDFFKGVNTMTDLSIYGK